MPPASVQSRPSSTPSLWDAVTNTVDSYGALCASIYNHSEQAVAYLKDLGAPVVKKAVSYVEQPLRTKISTAITAVNFVQETSHSVRTTVHNAASATVEALSQTSEWAKSTYHTATEKPDLLLAKSVASLATQSAKMIRYVEHPSLAMKPINAAERRLQAIPANPLNMIADYNNTLSTALATAPPSQIQALADYNGTRLVKPNVKYLAELVLRRYLMGKLASTPTIEPSSLPRLPLRAPRPPAFSPWWNNLGGGGGTLAAAGAGGGTIIIEQAKPALWERAIEKGALVLAKATQAAKAAAPVIVVIPGSTPNTHPLPDNVEFIFVDPENYTHKNVVTAIKIYEQRVSSASGKQWTMDIENPTTNDIRELKKILFGDIEDHAGKYHNALRIKIKAARRGPIAEARAERKGVPFVEPPWPRRPAKAGTPILIDALKTARKDGLVFHPRNCICSEHTSLLAYINKDEQLLSSPVSTYRRFQDTLKRTALNRNATPSDYKLAEVLLEEEKAGILPPLSPFAPPKTRVPDSIMAKAFRKAFSQVPGGIDPNNASLAERKLIGSILAEMEYPLKPSPLWNRLKQGKWKELVLDLIS